MSRRFLPIAAFVSLGIAAALRSTIRAPLFEEETGAVAGFVTSLPSWAPLLAWIAAGALAGILLSGTTAGRKSSPLLLAGLAAGIFLPGAFTVAPFLSLFSGALLDFVVVAAAVSAAAAVIPSRSRRARFEPSRSHVSLLAFIVLVFVGLKLLHDVGLSGDEPHYLLITHSVLEDGDLRVQNNYANEDHQRFYRGKIGPHLAAGTEYSIHGVGLPLLLVPGYGILGPSGVVVTLALLGALLAGAVFDIARISTGSHALGLVAASLFASTSPGLFLSVSAYPELPAALIVALVARRLLGPMEISTLRALGWGLLGGALPFFHMKFIPLMLVLWGALLYRLSARRALVAATVVSAAALMTFFYVTTGSVDPTASYGRQRVFLSSIPRGILGLLFDQEFGLLLAAPFYLIGIAGLVSLTRQRPFVGVVSIMAIAAVALPGGAHPLWSGGNSPPARFLFPVLPLLAVAAVSAWHADPKRGVTPWLPVLGVGSVCLSLFTLLLPGQPLYLNQRDGTGRLWDVFSESWDLPAYLPSVVTGDLRSMIWVGVATVAVIAAVGMELRRRPVPLPPFPVVVLLFFWIQDLTGVEPSRDHEGRWASAWMRDVGATDHATALVVPGHVRVSTAQSLERVSLPVVLRARDDGRYWSRAYSIPAGRYRLSHAPADWTPCNGGTCFSVPERDVFETGVAWTRFQLRAFEPGVPLRLRLEHGSPAAPAAIRSLSLPSGARLHGLDDDAYLDRRGYWVRSGRRSRFALEGGDRLLFRNGGAPNTVTVESPGGVERWEMEPGDEREMSLPASSGAVAFTVESASGFQPSALDPGSDDRRELGVFVTAPRF